MKCLRTFVVMAVLMAALLLPGGLTSQAQANGMGGNMGETGAQANIFTYPVYYAAPGGQWAYYGTYFVTQYGNGFVDWSQVTSVQNSLSQAGYWSYVGAGTFWRTTNNG